MSVTHIDSRDPASTADASGGFGVLGVALRDGRKVTIRAIREDDAGALQAAFFRLSREARYARFMMPIERLAPAALARAVHPADRELALVAVAGDGAGAAIVGGARHVRTSSEGTCEFAVTVADDWQGVGLASRLMRELIGDAAARGLTRMEGYVLATNRAMLHLARGLGFEEGASEEGPSVRLVRLEIARNERPAPGRRNRDRR